MRKLAVTLIAIALCGCGATEKVTGMFTEKETILAGDRIAVLPDNADIAVESKPEDNKLELPVAVDSDFWSQLGGTPANYVPDIFAISSNAGESLQEVSSAKAGDGNGWELPLAVQPVVAADKVFTIDSEGHVTAHSNQDVSKILWNYAPEETDEDPFAGGGLVYARGHLVAVTGQGRVIALSAETGKQEWLRELKMPVRSAPKSDGKYIYIKSVDNQLFALEMESGIIMWKHQGIAETAGVLAATVPAIERPVVVVPYSSGEIYGLEATTGREVWREMLVSTRTGGGSKISDIAASPILAEGKVYAGTSSGILAALDARNGMRIWERNFPGVAHIAVSGPIMFVTTTDNRIVALKSSNGRILWIQNLPGFGVESPETSWMGGMVLSERLAVFGRHGKIMLLAADTGKIISEISWPDGIKQLPAVASKSLYAVSDGATLYKLQ